MNEDRRADPDALLVAVEGESRGRLTVFLGAAAGVGKTYAMLEAALEQLASGVDVVAAWVETHRRKETQALLEGLPAFPPRRLEYRGKLLEELDLQGVLDRRPRIALVDELAHTNVPGSAHARRYQDVAAILAAGIDVYTTLNIQHLESLNDIVARITGVIVRETVPDRFLDGAAVKLVDIPADELLSRLREGKVYVPHMAARALEKFFRPGNLNALRELALRYTADKVDRHLGRYMRAHAIDGPWPVAERLMVCVSGSPFSAQVIRVGARMAKAARAEWFVVYVDTPGWAPPTEAERDRLSRNLRLAEELGGEVLTVAGVDVPTELLRLARERNASGLVIGKPLRRRWRDLAGGGLVDRVIRESQGLSVHVIPGPARRARERALDGVLAPRPRRLRVSSRGVAEAVLLVALVTAGLRLVVPGVDLVNAALIFLLPVVLGAARWDLPTSVVAAVLVAGAFDFFFVPPVGSFSVAGLSYFVSLVVLLAVAVLVSGMASRLRLQALSAQEREARTAALYALSRDIAGAADLGQLLALVARRAGEAGDGWAAVLLPGPDGDLEVRAWEAGRGESRFPEKERAVATWVHEHGEMAGHGTETLAGASGLHIAVRAEGRTVGVLSVGPSKPERTLSPTQRQFLEAVAALTATAVARARLADEAYSARLARDSERLRATLLDAVSHELRTPLAGVMGAVTGLLADDAGVYTSRAARSLLETIKEEADRMNVLVRNLLDMARLENGMLKLKTKAWEVQDVAGAALRAREGALGGRRVRLTIPEDLPAVPMDVVLIQDVLENLLDNAVKFSPAGSEVVVGGAPTADGVEVWVADRGLGIPAGELGQVFETSYRLRRPARDDGRVGSGVGLSVCRGIIEAHGGRIWAEANPGGGTLIRFTLPGARPVPPDAAPGAAHGSRLEGPPAPPEGEGPRPAKPPRRRRQDDGGGRRAGPRRR